MEKIWSTHHRRSTKNQLSLVTSSGTVQAAWAAHAMLWPAVSHQFARLLLEKLELKLVEGGCAGHRAKHYLGVFKR